jgi:hypothetical protein
VGEGPGVEVLSTGATSYPPPPRTTPPRLATLDAADLIVQGPRPRAGRAEPGQLLQLASSEHQTGGTPRLGGGLFPLQGGRDASQSLPQRLKISLASRMSAWSPFAVGGDNEVADPGHELVVGDPGGRATSRPHHLRRPTGR